VKDATGYRLSAIGSVTPSAPLPTPDVSSWEPTDVQEYDRRAMHVEWDPAKDRLNQRKHGIGFEDVRSVFEDPDRIDDYDHRDYGEDRWIVIGKVDSQVVFVVYTNRGGGVRLISARKAAPHEEARYYSRKLHG
jgi:uncharacterized DUF497 family protein